jgi:hypothetical protein
VFEIWHGETGLGSISADVPRLIRTLFAATPQSTGVARPREEPLAPEAPLEEERHWITRPGVGRGLIPLYFIALLAVQGLWEYDYPDFARIAADPFVIAVSRSRQFLYGSPVNFIIAWLLGLPNEVGFFLIHGVWLIALPLVVAWAIHHKDMADERKPYFVALLLLSPVWMACIKYFGKVDPIVIACLFVVWATDHPIVRPLAALGMVLAHQELGSVMLAMFYLTDRRRDHVLLLPFLVGNGAHWLYRHAVLDQVPVDRAAYMLDRLRRKYWPVLKLGYPVMLLAPAWYWVPLLLWPPGWLSIGLLVVSFTASVMTADVTRSFAMLSLPIILAHADETAGVLARLRLSSQRLLLACLILGVLSWEVAINGTVRPSGLIGAVSHYRNEPLR